MDLPPEDRKLLVDSLLKHSIDVALDPEAHAGWGTNACRITFNKEIFRRLILDAGK